MSVYNPRGVRWGILNPLLKFPYRLLRNAEYRRLNRFHYQLKRVPRYQVGKVKYNRDLDINYCDAPSFLSAFDEIFVNSIYDFETNGERPYIVDGGANIGLASLYWTLKFSSCEGVALEPDPAIFSILKKNLEATKSAIVPVQAALSESEDELRFITSGCDSGRVIHDENSNTIKVDAVKLSSLLCRPVDLLKIDIEGAELGVLEEAAQSLSNAKRIFVEAHSFVSREQDYGSILKLLQTVGFRCYVEVPASGWRGFGQKPVGEAMDLNLNIYGIRS